MSRYSLHVIRRNKLAVAVALFCTSSLALMVFVACGGGVRRLDVQDEALPMETRRWLADADDGVIVARSARDRTQDELRDAEHWQSRVNGETVWPGTGGPAETAKQALRTLAEARTTRARAQVEAANAELELAKSKRTLAHAERAVLHDIAQYNLVQLRAERDARREETTRASARHVATARAEDIKVNEWWIAYRAYLASGGQRIPLWIGRRAPVPADVAERSSIPLPDGGVDGARPSVAPGALGAISGARFSFGRDGGVRTDR